jgi:hypothetical protein
MGSRIEYYFHCVECQLEWAHCLLFFCTCKAYQMSSIAIPILNFPKFDPVSD